MCHLAGRPTQVRQTGDWSAYHLTWLLLTHSLQASQELDEILAVLAKKYQSTVFLRLPLQGSQLPELLGLPSQDGARLSCRSVSAREAMRHCPRVHRPAGLCGRLLHSSLVCTRAGLSLWRGAER